MQQFEDAARAVAGSLPVLPPPGVCANTYSLFITLLLPPTHAPPHFPPGVVLALDHSKVALSRTRCLYEASMALRLKGKTGFRVAIPGQLTASR